MLTFDEARRIAVNVARLAEWLGTRSDGRNMMTNRSIAIAVGGLALLAATMSPAFAQVTDKVRKACEAKADQVRPALRTPEREAFIANCLADATAMGGGKKN